MRARRSAPLTLRTYAGLASCAALLAPIWLAHRVRKGKEDAARLAERRGQASQARPNGPLVWIHGASVGEIISVLPLSERLLERGFACLITSGTLTSSRIVAQRGHHDLIHQFIPLDAPRFVSRFLDHWQPDLALIAESELWPTLFRQLGRRAIPMVLVNARLSQRSAKRWARLPGTAKALLGHADIALAQTPDDADRLRALGAPRVEVTGNLKFDAPAPPADPSALAALTRRIGSRPLFLAASTHPGEESIVIAAHLRLREALPGLLTVIAPRHPERGTQVRQEAEAAGLRALQRTTDSLPGALTEIYVADTIGELGLFYRLAPIVLMGGSLVRHGGQNPIEAAKLDAVVLHGPHVWNFADLYSHLDQRGGAVPVETQDDLVAAVLSYATDPALHVGTCEAARAFTLALGGALERTLSAIEPYLVQLRLEA